MILALLSLACTGDIDSQVVRDTSAEDIEGPIINHDPITETQTIGQPVDVICEVVDERSPIFEVTLHYRQETSTNWFSLKMDNPEGNTYTATIPGSNVLTAGMNYYIEASDEESNLTVIPANGAAEPYHFLLESAAD